MAYDGTQSPYHLYIWVPNFIFKRWVKGPESVIHTNNQIIYPPNIHDILVSR